MDATQVEVAFRRWGPVIYRHCRRLVGEGAAEDLTQEVFVRLWQRRDEIREADEGGRPLAWIYRVATNACLNHIRAHKRLTPLEDSGLPPPEAPEAGPERRAAVRAELDAIFEPYDQRTRDVITLVQGAGFTQQEAADMLGITRRTVFNRMRAFEADQARREERADA